jgi:hypothetical protein
MVPRLQAGDTRPNLHHNPCAFMAKNGGKQAFRIGTRQGEFIGMANARGADFHHDLAGLWAVKVDLHDLQRFSGGYGNGGAGAHDLPLPA